MGKVVVLNAAKMDFDGRLDFSVLSDEVKVYADSREDEILERVQDADAIVTKELVLSPELVASFPARLKLICEAGTGYNNIPLDAARAKGITVCNIPAYSTQRVAHTAVMLMLNLASSMQKQIRMLASGDRRNFTEHLLVPHVELNGKTLGVIGAGNIGRCVIRIARALEMNVLVYTRTPRADEDGVKYTTLENVLRESDFVSLHCPLTDKTRHIIDAKAIEMMKPTAFLINTSRGALVDEPALIDALKAGRIAGAGLDVQEVEPPAADNPLYEMDSVIITPHMGWKGMETRARLVSIIADDIQGFFAGRPINVVS
ncbi:MAG: hydroxyacid dehydrogenase [Pyramidobacter sp.]|jgi:glycerate dehydrogenase|nr:hydroxyacid dehydrogenase [Pyramidobacter sp.]